MGRRSPKEERARRKLDFWLDNEENKALERGLFWVSERKHRSCWICGVPVKQNREIVILCGQCRRRKVNEYMKEEEKNVRG